MSRWFLHSFSCETYPSYKESMSFEEGVVEVTKTYRFLGLIVTKIEKVSLAVSTQEYGDFWNNVCALDVYFYVHTSRLVAPNKLASGSYHEYSKVGEGCSPDFVSATMSKAARKGRRLGCVISQDLWEYAFNQILERIRQGSSRGCMSSSNFDE